MRKAVVDRTDLTAYDALWLEGYDAAHYGKGLSAAVMRRTHTLVERDPRLEPHYATVLEIGAGTMAHFGCVRHGFDRYIASDGDPQVVEWLGARGWDPRVEVMHLPGDSLPFDDGSIDRVVASHVLEHVPDPVAALMEWARVLRPGGVLSLIVPCDPGLAWRAGRMLGPRRAAEATGLPYNYYMAVVHRNAIFNLRHIVRHHFPVRRERWWPLHAPLPDLNLIYAVNCYV